MTISTPDYQTFLSDSSKARKPSASKCFTQGTMHFGNYYMRSLLIDNFALVT